MYKIYTAAGKEIHPELKFYRLNSAIARCVKDEKEPVTDVTITPDEKGYIVALMRADDKTVELTIKVIDA